MSHPLFERESAQSASVRASAYPVANEPRAASPDAPSQGAQPGRRARPSSWFASFVLNLAPFDWYIATYFVIMFLAVAFGSGPDREGCLGRVAFDVGCFGCGLVLSRGRVLRPGTFLNGLVYRMTIFLSVFLSYFQLRHILPAVSSRSVDAEILAFDLRVFHVEPSLAWDRFVNATTTEWFAFFYFGYFFVLTLHVIPIVLFSRSPRLLAHFAAGIVLVFCTGHLIYMVVPGYGPYHYLASSFRNELHGGLFWSWVMNAVQAGGAQKDIFPSLHTAAPTFFSLYSFRYRKLVPFKYTWPLVAFATSQIICATMFLRWHYLIDIFAGITLATTATLVGELLVRHDEKRRALLGDAVDPLIVALDWSVLTRIVRRGISRRSAE